MRGMRRLFRYRGLLLVNLALFVLFLVGLVLAGQRTYNAEQVQHGEQPVSVVGYLGTSNFGEAVFENWESEFLQMGMYVVLTAYLYQRGSAESRPLEGDKAHDEDPRLHASEPNVPWPVRRGGVVLKLYENSLAIFFGVLFLASILLHAWTGSRDFSAEELAHGGSPVTFLEYLGSSRFWFESFQNWQSEFLAVATLVGATIFLRQRRSPQSKPVATPHSETGA
jgi:hypothetical protein